MLKYLLNIHELPCLKKLIDDQSIEYMAHLKNKSKTIVIFDSVNIIIHVFLLAGVLSCLTNRTQFTDEQEASDVILALLIDLVLLCCMMFHYSGNIILYRDLFMEIRKIQERVGVLEEIESRREQYAFQMKQYFNSFNSKLFRIASTAENTSMLSVLLINGFLSTRDNDFADILICIFLIHWFIVNVVCTRKVWWYVWILRKKLPEINLGCISESRLNENTIELTIVDMEKTECDTCAENDSSHSLSFSTEECVICFDCYQPEEKLRKLNCGHIFHAACVDQWFRRSSNCPLCKHDVCKPIQK